MKTTITLFIEPNSLMRFIEVIKILDGLPLENDYSFYSGDIIYSEDMISNWRWVNMPIEDYLKFKYCHGKK